MAAGRLQAQSLPGAFSSAEPSLDVVSRGGDGDREGDREGGSSSLGAPRTPGPFLPELNCSKNEKELEELLLEASQDTGQEPL